jgi:hypothetical protein
VFDRMKHTLTDPSDVRKSAIRIRPAKTMLQIALNQLQLSGAQQRVPKLAHMIASLIGCERISFGRKSGRLIQQNRPRLNMEKVRHE